MQAIEDRAFLARKQMQQVCAQAGVHPSSWSRAKASGSPSVDTLLRMERAMDRIEAERAQ